jgi:hypothetical protein
MPLIEARQAAFASCATVFPAPPKVEELSIDLPKV